MVGNASGLYKFLIYIRPYAMDQKLSPKKEKKGSKAKIIPLELSVLAACGFFAEFCFVVVIILLFSSICLVFQKASTICIISMCVLSKYYNIAMDVN